VAHHLVVADKIAQVFATIGDDSVKTVVVISPNHFSQGVSPAQTTTGAWQTPYGVLESDTVAVEALLTALPIIKQEDQTFEREHGIAAISPFIKRSFPKAKIVALALDDSLTVDERKEIAVAIETAVSSATVISSIDMSHFLPLAVQEFHDEETLLTLAAGGCHDCHLEIDSNAALEVLFDFNAKHGLFDWRLTHHGSSLAMGLASESEDNTSHILGYFLEGEPQSKRFVSLHFVGDIMLDRGVRKQIVAANDVGYPWAKVQRFLSGSDLVVGNLEGTVNEQPSTYTYDPPFRFVFDPSYIRELAKYVDVVSLANNHASDVGSAGELETHRWLDEIGVPWFGSFQHPAPRYDTEINGFDLTFIGYHAFQPAEDELIEQIKAAKADGRFVIVMSHWGTEYQTTPDSNQRRLAQLMVDAGADLIIGGHPHVSQTIEEIDGVPVVYSLGNFIFDQEIPATWTAMTVGVIITDDGIKIYELPVTTRSGQPIPQ
jgi:poly-gamma-glutamate synthesis protein (capsule biosynthesis protein)